MSNPLQFRTREYLAARDSNPDDPVDMASVTGGVDGVTKVTANELARVTSADELAVRTRPIGQFLHIRARLPARTEAFAAIYAGVNGRSRATNDTQRRAVPAKLGRNWAYSTRPTPQGWV
jgi:hypothetical protein